MLSVKEILNAMLELVEIEDAMELAKKSYDDDTEDRLIHLESRLDILASRFSYDDCEFIELLAKDFKDMRAKGCDMEELGNHFKIMIESFIEYENSI